jgi:hypothetical protein
MQKSERSIWISFDLGIDGDYDGFYEWLDRHGAIECGDSTAFIENFPFEQVDGQIDEAVTISIKSSIKLTPKTRIHLIYKDRTGSFTRGKFIIGGRKRNPWAGYAPAPDLPEEIVG